MRYLDREGKNPLVALWKGACEESIGPRVLVSRKGLEAALYLLLLIACTCTHELCYLRTCYLATFGTGPGPSAWASLVC